MATKTINRKEGRNTRHRRVRSQIKGTAARPRASVFRSSSHISVQIIDDDSKKTIVSTSDKDVSVNGKSGETKGVAIARAVGGELAKRAKKAGIESVVFDRGGFKYHGRVKALAEGARSEGLTF